MRKLFIGLVLGFSLLAAAETAIVERETKTSFAPHWEVSGTTLACTGVAVRQVYGFDVYGIGHYGDPADAPKPEATAEEKLAHWIKSSKTKAMIIKFVFHADKQNMRNFAGKSLEDAGYTGEKQEKFLEAFAQDYSSGSEAKLIATGSTLRVEIDGQDKGSWDDADLVRALWECWLGNKSVLKKREGLVTLPEVKPAGK
jgi:hypothetical protein